MSRRLKVQINVRSYEVDIYGHVNNAVYLNYLEHGRVKALEQTGKSFLKYMEENLFIVIARIDIAFRQPAYLNDELDVVSYLKKVGRTSVILQQDIYNRSRQEETASAEVTMVFLSEKKKPIPVSRGFLKQMGWQEESE